MAGSRLPKQLALDTNLVLDLAEGQDFAHSFRELFQERLYTLSLPPTATLELHENSLYAPAPQKRELARLALLKLRSWGIRAFELSAVQHAIAERFAAKLGEKGLLPAEEFNDAAILAESSLEQIPLLVTSDKH